MLTTPTTERPVYTPEKLRERIAFYEKQIETWKGNPDYLAKLQMELWALTLAAAMLEVAGDVISKNPRSDLLSFEERQRACMLVVEGISSGELGDVLH